MSEQINLQGVVSKPRIGASWVFRWLGYALITIGALGSTGRLLPMIDVSFIDGLLSLNGGPALIVGVILLALANVTALFSEIFDANHTIID